MTELHTTIGLLDTGKLARSLVASYVRFQEAKRPIDRKTADAEIHGMARACDALGLAHTPDHVKTELRFAAQRMGDRPAFRFTSSDNSASRTWDEGVAHELTKAMGW